MDAALHEEQVMIVVGANVRDAVGIAYDRRRRLETRQHDLCADRERHNHEE